MAHLHSLLTQPLQPGVSNSSPANHVCGPLIRITLEGEEKDRYSDSQRMEAQRERKKKDLDERMLPSCGQGEKSLNDPLSSMQLLLKA